MAGFKGYTVTAPDGKTYDVNAPEGTSDEELYEYVQTTYYSNDNAPEPETPPVQQAPVAAPKAAPTAVTPEVAPLNAFRDSTGEQTVATKALAEVPGAQEYATELFFKGVPYGEAARAFTTKFPQVQFHSENAPKQWAENLAYAQTPEGRAHFSRVSPFEPVNVPTGVQDVNAPDSALEEFGVSAKRSLANMANTVTGAAALASDLVGADETAQGLADTYLETQAAIGMNYPTSAGQAVEIRSFDDFGRWAASTLGELAPQLTSSLGGGAVGGLVARKIVERKARDFVEQRVAEGGIREVAEAEVARQIQKATVRGGIVGAGAISEVQEVGSVYGDTYGATGELAPWTSLLAGTAAAALDTVLPARILSKVGGPVANDIIVDGLVKRVGKEAAAGFLMEGGTEAIQTIIEQLPSGQPIQWDHVLEAALRGGFGGSVASGAAGAYQGAREAKANPTAPAATPSYVPEGAEPISVPTSLNRRTKAFKAGIEATRSQVEERARGLVSNWENAPEVTVHQNFNQLQGVANNAVGVYANGKLQINTEALLRQAEATGRTPDQMVAALTYHEGLGHHGLAVEFGDTLDDKLSTMLENSPVYQGKVRKWLKENPEAYAGDRNRDIRAFEELLAEGSEKGQLPTTYINQMKNTIKDFGRRIGVNMQYSTREVETILGMAHSAVVNGKGRDVRSNGYRYMYAGEAADTADKFSLQETLMRERRGEDIGVKGRTRNETGWFRGPDGQMRFEIDDSTASAFTPEGAAVSNLEMLANPATGPQADFGKTLERTISDTTSRLNGLYTRLNRNDPNDDRAAILRAIKKLEEKLASFEQEPQPTELSLGEVLSHNPVFDAYPELKDIRFNRAPTMNERNLGSYNPTTKTLWINPSLNETDAIWVTLHEVQHAIQDIEGFAKGGNAQTSILKLDRDHLKSTAQAYYKWKKRRLKEQQTQVEALKVAVADPDMNEAFDAETAYKQTAQQVAEERAAGVARGDDDLLDWMEDELEELADKQFAAEARFLSKLGLSDREDMSMADIEALDKVYTFFEKFTDSEARNKALQTLEGEVGMDKLVLTYINEAIEQLKKNPDSESAKATLADQLTRDGIVARQAYESLFGEVEARDTQARMKMSPSERRATEPYTAEGRIDPSEYVFDMEPAEADLREASVWHGSPHDFDEFDHSKMGTGEGAQVYGWGTYLTETRGIAEDYKRVLSRKKGLTGRSGTGEIEVNGQSFSDWFKENQPVNFVRNPAVPDYEDGRPAGRKRAAQFGEDLYILVPALTTDVSDMFHDIAKSQWAEQDFQAFYDQQADYANDIGRQLQDIETMRYSGELTNEQADKKAARLEETLNQLKLEADTARKILDGMARNPGGKLYEVDIPDDAKWLEWDRPLQNQSPEVQKILKEQFDVGDRDKAEKTKANLEDEKERLWNQIGHFKVQMDEAQKDYGRTQEAQDKYKRLKAGYERRHKRVLEVESEIRRITGELEMIDGKTVWQTWDGPVEVALTGQHIYAGLEKRLGSDKEASLALDKAGIVGMKYLDGMSREDGEGTYNYVVFNDKTPKIVNKYMMLTAPDKVQFTPEEIEAMSPEDLFESQNAYTILQRMTEGYTPVVMSLDDLHREAELRGFSPNEIMKSKGADPGDLVKRIYQYDIAANKLQDRITELYGKMQDGKAKPSDIAAHAKALYTMQEITQKIFDVQGELGRSLAAMKTVNFTRRRVGKTMEMVAQFQKGSPFEFMNDPDEYMKFAMSIQQQIEQGREKMKSSGMEFAANALNLPRAIMSTLDLSAPLRQGFFLIHKGAWWRSFANMLRYWTSEQAYKDLREDIQSRPTFSDMLTAKLALSDIDGKLNSKEEDFQTEWAQKIPGFGIAVRMSERAYGGFLNKLRADVFDQLVAKLPEYDTIQERENALRDIGRFVNAASGRGNLPKAMQSSAPVLNALFFSPRLIASRVVMTTALVDPRTYTTMNKVARNEYIKSILSVGTLALTVLTLAFMGGAEVEKDPRSSDFAKIKIGNTRYDVLGGEGQYITLAARMALGAEKTADGQIRPYGTDFGQKTKWDAALKFATNKSAPIPSFVIDYLRGTNAIGEKFEWDKAIIQRMVPMIVTDVYDNMKEEGVVKGAAMTSPAVFGVGVQNYKSYSQDAEREIDAPETFKMKTAKDGDYNNATVEDGIVMLDEEAQKEWSNRLNTYIREWMKDEMAKPEWKTMTREERADAIKKVRDDARKETKADMLELLQIEEE